MYFSSAFLLYPQHSFLVFFLFLLFPLFSPAKHCTAAALQVISLLFSPFPFFQSSLFTILLRSLAIVTGSNAASRTVVALVSCLPCCSGVEPPDGHGLAWYNGVTRRSRQGSGKFGPIRKAGDGGWVP